MGLLSILIPAAAYAFFSYWGGHRISPDGRSYLSEDPPAPFSYRLIRKIIPRNYRAWQIATGVFLVGTGPVLFAWLRGNGCPPDRALLGVALWAGLNGVFYVNVQFPVLTDAPAIFMMLATAALDQSGHKIIAWVFAFAALSCKETTPLFIALITGRSDYLVLYIPFVFVHFLMQPVKAHVEPNPMKMAWELHRTQWLNAGCMIAPWGACLYGLMHPTPRMLAMLAICYGQLLIANDCVRLYQVAFPLLLLSTVQNMPVELWAIAIALHFCNPFKKYFF